jgi:exopolyphosphatase/guanosine-5'-triphosphate,3'-diphosphate pyrophosphatase
VVDGRPVRVAAIDCGTNSIRLLIADAADGRLTDVVREMRIVRLGEGVDRTGRFAAEALERTRVALHDYAASVRAEHVERVRMVATSATRDAGNRDEFVMMVRAELGVPPEVISGQEEAGLSFAGAASVLPDLRGPLLVADIGGGSTELVRGVPGGQLQAYSMDVGCVRMTERHLHDDPPTAGQIDATVAELRDAIARAGREVPLDPDATFIGVAGTVTTIAAIALELDSYDPVRIHGARISAAQIADVTDRLLRMTRQQRAALPVMHPGRVDVIGGGALVLRTLMEAVGTEAVLASEHDILDGIALGLG